jgi:hypothetical protein
MAGTDRGHDCSDPSLWPEGYFLCWSEFCKLDSEYCERPLGDGNDANIYEHCIELPEPCLGLADPNALCACVIDESYEGSDYYDCVPTERNGAVGASIFFYLI